MSLLSGMRAGLAAVALVVTVQAATAQPVIPDTPAGRVLSAWLAAINTTDRITIEAYAGRMQKQQSVESMLNFRAQTGGFDLQSVRSISPLRVSFQAREKARPIVALGTMTVREGNPPTVESFILQAVPRGATPVDVTFDSAYRKRVVEEIGKGLNESYVDAVRAAGMAKAIQTELNAGAYDAIDNGIDFAARLQKDLRAVSKDLHLSVNFSPMKMPPPTPPTADDLARNRQQTLRNNCAFNKAEILPGNVGYLKFNGFSSPEVCGAVVAAAMGFVANTDALIVDLRENGGGDPDMVALISSYLFDKPTHLNDLYTRKTDTTKEFWTLATVPGERLIRQPVFVLTAKRTFSAAEEFSYNLKNQKRATIVGEVTGGGAHPVSGQRLADYFMVGIPYAKAVNPVSKTNWEGTGVEPDVKVPAADALATAQKLAAERITGAKNSEK